MDFFNKILTKDSPFNVFLPEEKEDVKSLEKEINSSIPSPRIEDSLERGNRLSASNSEALVQESIKNKDETIAANAAAAAGGPWGMIASAVTGAIDQNKKFIGDNLSMMGSMAGSMLASQALENISQQESNDAYKKNLAQKTYDSVQMFNEGGPVQLFNNGKGVARPDLISGEEPTIKAATIDDFDEYKDFDLFGDEYFEGFMDYRKGYNKHAYKQDEIGEKFYANIFNYGIDKVSSIVDDIYGKEYGYGSGEKTKNLMRMTLVNEASYGQKTNLGPIEGRGYTSGYISADDSGHFYHIAENMAKYADKTEDQAMNLNRVTRTFWYAAKMAERLGIDPKDTDKIIDRMRKGDPIVSMMMNTAQIFRNIEDPSTGSDKYPAEVKDKIRKVNKVSKSDWKKMDKDDLRGLAVHWLSGWNGYGNLKYRNMDPEEAIKEATKAYKGVRDAGLFEVGVGENFIKAKPQEVNIEPEIPTMEEATQLVDNTVSKSFGDNYEHQGVAFKPVINSALDNFLNPDYRNAINVMSSIQDYEKENKKIAMNQKGKTVSYRKGGKVYKGVVVGYRDGKPIIKKR